jgi:hypothetical protein
MILSLISNLIKALCSYLELKNKSFYYDILEKSRKRQKDLVEQIEELRDRGDSQSANNADTLVLQLLDERKWIKNISNTYSSDKSGN